MIDIKEKRITITGGTGFLGSFVVDELKKKGVTSIFVPRSSKYNLVHKEKVKQLFDDTEPDILIHLAAKVGGIGFLMKNPGIVFYENAMMGIQLLEESRKRDIEKVVLIGTVCSYPKITKVPFKEDNLWDGYPDEITGYYGIAKKILHVQAMAYREQYGLNTIYLLPTNLYGPRDNFDLESSHVIPALIRKIIDAKANNKKYITVWGTGNATREFLYVKDAAKGIVQATELYNNSAPVNLGTGIEISIKDITQKIMNLVSYKGELRFDKSKPDGQPRRCLDVSRAFKEFGFKASTPIEQGLKETIAWYKANREKN